MKGQKTRLGLKVGREEVKSKLSEFVCMGNSVPLSIVQAIAEHFSVS